MIRVDKVWNGGRVELGVEVSVRNEERTIAEAEREGLILGGSRGRWVHQARSPVKPYEMLGTVTASKYVTAA